ncbi:MAG: UDP-N-acetylmuramoyl-L-alanine--D-glutamate ligase [Endomicrobium sp.]|jgi:UDP-N-acetylmuramoylalanine--D-glutamate ligase|nr:UDP-N-acetylmuramoyl-L-alanine--D-glutamate ligase [Endomicrobium sp.]
MWKNIGVLGLGKSGIAVANLAIKLGCSVFASDNKEKQIKNVNKKAVIELGSHSDKILNSNVIIKSPGVCPTIPILEEARRRKIEIISELAFSLANSKYKKLIAVTGTNGKTTTTDLISKIIKSTYKDSIVAGNIGSPLADKALKTTQNTYITVELSSYQLEDTPKFRPDIAVLLNITSDHIEHHKTMKAYIKAKENIFINQKHTDYLVVNHDDKVCRQISAKSKAKIIYFSKKYLKSGVFYDNGKIVIGICKKCVKIEPKINMVGSHNIENILAAVATSYIAGITSTTIEKIVSKYKGVEHRIEFVKTLGGVDYYNDSKATNVDSTRAAIQSFDGNILLIMGGRDKGYPYTALSKLIKQKVKAIFLIGEASGKIKKNLANTTAFFDCTTLENAVNQIFKVAVKGDIVLFSPACASFDQFNNFEERGMVFKQFVNKLR